MNPIITQRLLNEIHCLAENLRSNNNNSFMIMNSSTIELFEQLENVFQKYFSQFNIDELFLCITGTDKNQQRWPCLLTLLHGNLIKFTLIEELKLINEVRFYLKKNECIVFYECNCMYGSFEKCF